MKIGRNDPCPCGSGLKYKKCCYGKQEPRPLPVDTGAVMEELRELIKERSFESIEEANAFISGHMQERNRAAVDDFHGLSPEQMTRFLYFPFESPHLLAFRDCLDVDPDAPILKLFMVLAEAAGDGGLKATATGNLPRQFCRDAALAFLGEEGYREKTRHFGINTEPDFPELHVTRVVAELAGLVRKYKGKFILGRECRKLLAEGGAPVMYPRLFRAFVGEYNWGYQDRYPDFRIIQQSFPFTLYLLHKYGAEWRPSAFYADCFLRAFPMVLAEIDPSPIGTPEDSAGRCYALRSLERFAEFLGLAEIDLDPDKRFMKEYRLRKLPLLDHIVQFHL